MNIINIVSYVCLALIVFGFFLGFFRSLKKSLARCLLIIGSLLVAIFVAPILSKFLISTYISGYEFNGFGFSFDFKEIIEGMVGEEGSFAEILSATATENLITSVINIVVNIVAFILIFLALYILTLIIFWISSFIIRISKRKNEAYQEKRRKSKTLPYRLGGGLIGIVSSIAFCFIVAIPLFGVMNICDQFLVESSTESANAVSTQNLICGNLYYKEDESIGTVENYIEQYAEIKKQIDGSAIGTISNAVGISEVGKLAFNYLTTVEQGGLKISLTNEIVSMIKMYNIYKEGFVVNEFDSQSKESIDKALDTIELIYNEANNSSIVKSYILELVPQMREKWVNGEKFLGIEFPIKGDYADLALLVIDKGFDTYSLTEINNNIYAVINIVRIANDAGVVESVLNEEDIINLIKEDDTHFIKNVIVELSKSKVGDALPDVIQKVVKIAYKAVIDDSLSEDQLNYIFISADNEIPDEIDWETEGLAIENIINSALNIADTFYSSETEIDTNKMIENLDKIGIVIDNARKSIFSAHFKILVYDMINIKIDSDILGDEATSILKQNLSYKWSVLTFKFEEMFNVIKQTALLAQKITIDADNIDKGNLDEIVDNLEMVVGELISSDHKDDYIYLIKNTIIENFIPAEYSETVVVVKDMVSSFLNNTTQETLSADIVAGKEIINIVNTSVNERTFTLGSETATAEEKEAKAEQIANAIVNSNAIMIFVENAVDSESSNNLQEMTQRISGDDIEILKDAISAIDTTNEDSDVQSQNEANKEALMKLFGIEA